MPRWHTTTKLITQPYPGPLVEVVNRGAHVFMLFRLKTGKYGWGDYKLECRSERRTKSLKANWWLSFNGSRLSHSRDACLLADRLPDIHAWSTAVLSQQIHREQSVCPLATTGKGATP